MKDSVRILAGAEPGSAVPLAPFSEPVLAFLDTLSKGIFTTELRERPELAAFGFWCRRAHLTRLRERCGGSGLRLGRGLVFHIAPGNVPVMFGYSLAVGLLAGNANIVRVSERSGAVGEALCGLLRELLEREEHRAIRERCCLLQYPRDDAITAEFLSVCDTAVVWGGDATIAAVRRFPMKPGAELLAFPDRHSLALLSQRAVSGLEGEAFDRLIRGFYNDTYVMDQNACSSPCLVLWLADGGTETVRERFWQALVLHAAQRGYPMDAWRAVRKYEALSLAGLRGICQGCLRRYGGNLLYVVRLEGQAPCLGKLPGGFGLFYEAEAQGPEDLLPWLSQKTQTLGCFGLDRRELARTLVAHGARGVDRVVEIGQCTDFSVVWDGKNLINRLSREIDVE